MISLCIEETLKVTATPIDGSNSCYVFYHIRVVITQYKRSFLSNNSFLFLYMGTCYTEGNFYANFSEEFQFDNFSIGLNQLVDNAD
jgi:hypothetical protein